MTVTEVDWLISPGNEQATGTDPARWTLRAGALALDTLPGIAVLATTALVTLSVPLHGLWWWVCVSTGAAAILWTAFNRLLLPIVDGRSLGRAVFGIAVVDRNGEPVGLRRLLLRDLAHLLDTAAMFAGRLWPLWDSRRRTFADRLSHTESRLVQTRRADRNLRRLAAAVVLTAAGLCALMAVISYTVVRRHDQSVTAAGAQVAAQGPGMVSQMLSYHPETIRADFDRAQSLATDHYRAELAAQQQAVQKAKPVHSEYWVTSSAVLSATPDRVTMLLFLQGEQGALPDQRYITASVRAIFESGAAGWRVNDLAVVTEPRTAEAQP